ncbi:nuclear transport factor 2 family protein [Gordonia hydrophobica]|uniref:Nuclear transport factor 2 family protein n=1 Tax=Gordonia hydrophobica TaxID=40516 RepID=A0ABZ2TWA8_9ACTN|nr:nuclear transport factor 2 family protein [Gordonia hydrophobica]MBM7365839.1 ketosteroid isomerase-like protein [Gordonia hydrophobica]
MRNRGSIENLISRYSLSYDTADMEAIAACFTDDAVFRMTLPGSDPVTFDGRDAIMALMEQSARTQTDQRRHVNSNLIVHPDVDGVTKTTHYLTLLATENGEIRVLTAGVYRLEIVGDDEDLRFRALDLELDRPY